MSNTISPVQLGSLGASAVHAARVSHWVSGETGYKTLCGRELPEPYTDHDWTKSKIDCSNCKAALRRYELRGGGPIVIRQGHPNWGGPRPGAGRPKQYERVPVGYLKALHELVEVVKIAVGILGPLAPKPIAPIRKALARLAEEQPNG